MDYAFSIRRWRLSVPLKALWALAFLFFRGIQQSILAFLEHVVKVQERRGFENDSRPLNVMWVEKERPEAEQQPVNRSQN